MKLHSHRPLRSNFPNFIADVKRTVLVTEGDHIRLVRKRRDAQDKQLQAHLAIPDYRRVACVRKKTVEGVKGFHVVGIGFQPLTMGELKIRMAVEGFTGFRMGAVHGDLRELSHSVRVKKHK